MSNFTNRTIVLFCYFLFICTSGLLAQIQDTLWTENWEGDWTQDWHVSTGTWEVGEPTSGPDSALTGKKCAATVLAGNYSEWVDSKLIRKSTFEVPSNSKNPRLRFWHWYSISADDTAFVEINAGGNGWTKISPSYTHTGSQQWTYASIDLTSFAGQTVQLAFRFITKAITLYNGTRTHVSSGWYIDDVSVISGTIVFNNPETWENGIGDWNAERGTWQVGSPSNGPNSAYAGEKCAGTALDGNYDEWVSSRLVSPEYKISSDFCKPELCFWHWYSISADDTAFVEIKVKGGDWNKLSRPYIHTSGGVWTFACLDLTAYADSTVQFGFRFKSRAETLANGTRTHVSFGWYIDDIKIDGICTEVQESFIKIPTNYTLAQNHPNPFNPETAISFSLPKAGPVAIRIYDLMGKEIRTLINENRSAGMHVVNWDSRDGSGARVPSGVYVYRMTAGRFTAVKKMLLLK